MSDSIITKRIKNSIGLILIFWVTNGFRYEGKIIECDDTFLEYFDKHKMATRYVRLDSISQIEVQNA